MSVDLLPTPALVIGADRFESGSGGEAEHVNPSTGKPQAVIPLAGVTEVDAAVRAAAAAFEGWRRTTPPERRDILLRIASSLRDHEEELATVSTLENGAPCSFTPLLSSVIPAEFCSYYAGWVDKLHGEVVPVYPGDGLDYTLREPYGVVGVIIPWNGPMTSIGQKVIPAIAAGNTVVLKPPELAPFTSLVFHRICTAAGLPPGVLNVISGGPEAGEALVGHPGVGKITFTGGGATAEAVLRAAATNKTPVVLELGGKSANLVFADADLDAAVTMAVQYGIATLSGQACMLPTRLLVERSVYQEVLDEVVAVAESLPVGDPFDAGTMMGPVISARHCQRILDVIERARSAGEGTLLTGGERLGGSLADGYFLPPTVFGDVDPRSPLAQEEIFGPVLAVMPFDDEEHAISLANDTDYGLAGFIWTADVKRAHRTARALDAGYIGVNGMPLMPPTTPFGGYKQSGFGREGGLEGLLEFSRTKNVYVELG